MRARIPAAAIALGLALMLAPSMGRCAGEPVAAPEAASAARARTCATPEPTAVELDRLRASIRLPRDERAAPTVGGTIQVAFHVIHDGWEGRVTDEQVREQIRELNRTFLGTGYRFSLASVDHTDSKRFFKVLPFTGDERHMKEALAIDPARRLNVYSCAPGRGLLGWAYFPFSFPEDDPMHGVVIHHGTLPGGGIPFYNLGRTLTHEVGHYLGLFHTFQGGCAEPGDHVADTPAEAIPNFACPESRNTCPSPGDDPIHNYMDYSIDECYTEFTRGQDARMDAIVPAFRPSLLNAEIALAPEPGVLRAAPAPPPGGGVVVFRGAWPNPFREDAVLRFSLPASAQVRLRVFSLAGQLVATLVDARMPPGDHSAPFRAAGLPAGLYFASLHVDGAVHHRSLIHLP